MPQTPKRPSSVASRDCAVHLGFRGTFAARPCTGRMRQEPSARSFVILKVEVARSRIKEPNRKKQKIVGSFTTYHRASAGQQKLDYKLVASG